MSNEQSQDKTEQATPRKLEKAEEEGQVATSADFSAGILLLAASFFFIMAGPWLGNRLLQILRQNISAIYRPDLTADDTNRMIQGAMEDMFQVLWPLALITFSVALLLSFAVTGLRITLKPLKPDWDKANPQKGVKKIFSSKSVVRGLMAVAKITIMSLIAFWIIQKARGSIEQTEGRSLSEIVSVGWLIVTQIVVAIAASITTVGAFDLIFQKWKHHQDLRMSKQEVRDEMKDTEGDPHLKARIRQIQRELSSRQMMKDVPSSTVVVTNPTHFAVALRYQQPRDEAPIVVAKGVDVMAQQIKIVAHENHVPVIERKPLARALYQSVEVGQEIPLELYQAVAEILAYVMEQRTILS